MKIKRLRLKIDSVPCIAIQSRDRWIPLQYLATPDDQAIDPSFTDMISVLQTGQALRDKWQAMADNFDDELPEIDKPFLQPWSRCLSPHAPNKFLTALGKRVLKVKAGLQIKFSFASFSLT